MENKQKELSKITNSNFSKKEYSYIVSTIEFKESNVVCGSIKSFLENIRETKRLSGNCFLTNKIKIDNQWIHANDFFNLLRLYSSMTDEYLNKI